MGNYMVLIDSVSVNNNRNVFLSGATIVNTFNTITSQYGALYNWYAAADTKKISSSDDWVIPPSDYVSQIIRNLYSIYGLGTAPENSSPLPVGKYFKELGTTYWSIESTGDNNMGFNSRGSGYRDHTDGLFYVLDGRQEFFCAELLTAGLFQKGVVIYANDYIASSMLNISSGISLKRGASLRLVKYPTTLSSGETGTYIGNDGKAYETIAISDGLKTVEWLSENLYETKYRTGDFIPIITGNTEWVNGGVTPITITGSIAGYASSYSTTPFLRGQGFVVGNCSISSITISNPSKLGNPNFSIRVSIYNSSGGLPTTSICNSTNLIGASSTGSMTFLFADQVLSAGSYCYVISYESVVVHDDSNNKLFAYNNDDTYIDGDASYNNGGSWTLSVGIDLNSIISFTPIGAMCYYNNDINNAYTTETTTGATDNHLVLLQYDDEFIFSIALTATGGTSITLPLVNDTGYTYNASVDWGDGSARTSVTAYNSAGATHAYSGAGNYDVRIRGACQAFSINNTSALRSYITKVKFWGNCGFKKLDFYGSTILSTLPPGELTGMSGMTVMSNFLRGCTSYRTPLISNFFINTPNVRSFDFTFANTSITGSIPEPLFSYTPGATNFDYTFSNTLISGSIPATLFSYTTGVTTFDFTFANSYVSGTIPATLFSYHPNVDSFAGTFSTTRVSGQISSTLFSYATGVTDFSYTFNNTTYITGGTIPSTLFSITPKVNTFAFTFNSCYVAGSIPSTLFSYASGVTTFQSTFSNNPYLTGDIPVELFVNNTGVTSFNSTFSSCYGLGTGVGGTGYYTEDLFKYNPKVIDFGGCFQATWGLTTGLTDKLFMNNPNVTSFSTTFGFCATLRSPLPEDLFRYNTGVTSFFNTFNKLYEVPGPIPAGLFKYNTKVTDFSYTFSYGGNGYDYPHGGVGGISGDIPVDLFANCPDVVNFIWTFRWNTGVWKVPNGLFRNNLKATQFINCFLGAQYAAPEQYIFSSGSTISGITEDQAAYTRFSGKTMNFSSMFNGNSGAANSRFAPELWDPTKYNMVANTHTDCYTGTLSAYINGANIPYDWRGYYAPTLTTTAASNITTTGMTSGGNITSAGGLTVTSRGVCYNTSGTPTTGDTKTSDGTGPGIFTSTLTGLAPATPYYLRAYAINAAGVSYGNQVTASTS